MNRNVTYQTDQLVRYFTRNRLTWLHFYESERFIISRLNLDSDQSVLDIGCGCGGLGLALRERFGVEKYTGVEINSLAAEAGRTMNPGANILCGDVLELGRNELCDRRFNVVFSLSCVDWNVRFADMLAAAWEFVLPGGHLIATFRLVEGEGCDDMRRSYQYINYEGVREGECASYVVLNARDLLEKLTGFGPSEIGAYGYWGAPSATAVTPYEQLCFAAFSIRKPIGVADPIRFDLQLPEEIRKVMGFS